MIRYSPTDAKNLDAQHCRLDEGKRRQPRLECLRHRQRAEVRLFQEAFASDINKEQGKQGGLVMRGIVCGLMILVPSVLPAWQTENAFEIAMTNALYNRSVLTSVAFTNELYQYISSVSNCDSALTAQIMKAICLYERYECSADDSFLDRSIEVASNCVEQTYSQSSKWQCWMSRLVLMGGLAACNQSETVYQVATNALAGMSAAGFQGSSNRVAVALIRYHDVPELSLPDTIRAFSAIAAALQGQGTVATNLCGTLPVRYRMMVDECMSQQ